MDESDRLRKIAEEPLMQEMLEKPSKLIALEFRDFHLADWPYEPKIPPPRAIHPDEYNYLKRQGLLDSVRSPW